MPGEGEQREGGNPGEDPFARYAEELGRKSEETKGSDEGGPNISNSDAVPRQEASSTEAKDGIKEDEFEAYAKELREKYAEEAGAVNQSQDVLPSQTPAEVPVLTEQHMREEEVSGRQGIEQNQPSTEAAKQHHASCEGAEPDEVSSLRWGAKSSEDINHSDTLLEENSSENEQKTDVAKYGKILEGSVEAGGQAQRSETSEGLGDREAISERQKHPANVLGRTTVVEADDLKARDTQTGQEGSPLKTQWERHGGEGVNAAAKSGSSFPNPAQDNGIENKRRPIFPGIEGAQSLPPRPGVGSVRHDLGDQLKLADLPKVDWETNRPNKNGIVQDPQNHISLAAAGTSHPDTGDSKSPSEAPKNHSNAIDALPKIQRINPAGGSENIALGFGHYQEPLPGKHDARHDPIAEMDLRVRIYRRTDSCSPEVHFAISKRETEIQTGLIFTLGNTYRLKGRIGNLWDFEVERTMTRDRYLNIFVPLKFHKDFKRDGRYRVVLESIQLVKEGNAQPSTKGKQDGLVSRLTDPVEEKRVILTRTPQQEGLAAAHMLKAYALKRERPTIVFSLSKSWIETETGHNLEAGNTYRINGVLGEICKFSTLLRETGYSQDLKVYAPFDYLGKFRPGEKYSVRVSEVNDITGAKENFPRKVDQFWDWKTVAAWADTEGWYYSKRHASRAIISQKEREPLDGIHDFLHREGIPSVVYHTPKGYYELRTMGGIESMAKFVLNTEPYIRTNNKREQIAKFKGMISVHTKNESAHVRQARRILGILISDSKKENV